MWPLHAETTFGWLPWTVCWGNRHYSELSLAVDVDVDVAAERTSHANNLHIRSCEWSLHTSPTSCRWRLSGVTEKSIHPMAKGKIGRALRVSITVALANHGCLCEAHVFRRGRIAPSWERVGAGRCELAGDRIVETIRMNLMTNMKSQRVSKLVYEAGFIFTRSLSPH